MNKEEYEDRINKIGNYLVAAILIMDKANEKEGLPFIDSQAASFLVRKAQIEIKGMLANINT